MLEIVSILKDLNILKVEGKTGAHISTFRIGGNLKNLIYIENKESLSKLLAAFYKENIEYIALGNCSNVLFRDEDIKKVIINLSENFSNIEKISDNKFYIGASSLMPTLSSVFQKEALSGFEFGCNLPAKLGGTIFMNASFRGQKVSDILESVDVCLENGEYQTMHKENLTIVEKQIEIPKNSIIVGATFNLFNKPKNEIQDKIDENKDFRLRTQPKGASAGCIFKNPKTDMPAGMLIDKAGLKGRAVGGAQVSTLHANWIINTNLKATSSDVRKLIDIIKEKVFKEFNVELETELVLL
ncbi:MAG: UDP-N-acetylmuramate dehydrogenase [Bdellovibrionota bacterium]